MRREKSGVPLPHTQPVVPWNKGRFVGPKPPLKPKQVWAIRLHLQREEWIRDLAMFDLAIDSSNRHAVATLRNTLLLMPCRSAFGGGGGVGNRGGTG